MFINWISHENIFNRKQDQNFKCHKCWNFNKPLLEKIAVVIPISYMVFGEKCVFKKKCEIYMENAEDFQFYTNRIIGLSY